MKKLLIVLVVLLSIALPIFGVAAQDSTIVDVISANSNFSTLVSAIEAAGLTDMLNSEGAFTVYAPTNAAFEALPVGVLDYLLANPDRLAQVLAYHILSGDVALTEPVNVITADIAASNGVIHAIDQVLTPEITLPAVDPLIIMGDIITAGSSTVFPLSERVVEAFRNAGYADNATVDSIGSGAGIERFCVSGEIDVINASRAIRDSEIESCLALNPPRHPIEFRVGTDALAVVVAEANDFVTDLTIDQLAHIFSGEYATWSAVDPSYPAEPIQLFSPGTDSGTFDYFVEAVMTEIIGEGGRDAIINAPNIQFSEDDNVLVQGVESSPYAIGYFGYAYYVDEQDRLNAVSVDGVQPNGVTAEDGSYPLARPMYIYSDAGIFAAKPQVADFVNFYLTNVNSVIEEVGYFPASAQALNLAKLALLANMGT